jgi:hypothetical protein
MEALDSLWSGFERNIFARNSHSIKRRNHIAGRNEGGLANGEESRIGGEEGRSVGNGNRLA